MLSIARGTLYPCISFNHLHNFSFEKSLKHIGKKDCLTRRALNNAIASSPWPYKTFFIPPFCWAGVCFAIGSITCSFTCCISLHILLVIFFFLHSKSLWPNSLQCWYFASFHSYFNIPLINKLLWFWKLPIKLDLNQYPRRLHHCFFLCVLVLMGMTTKLLILRKLSRLQYSRSNSRN